MSRSIRHRSLPGPIWLAIVVAACGAGEVDRAEEESTGGPEERSEPSGDLGRFVGEYGTSASQARNRTFWVVEHCDGHLVAGATWGDASPWHLESVSEATFVQRVPQGVPAVRLEFDTGSDGAVESLRVLYDGRPFLEDHPVLERLSEIPPGFDSGCWDSPGG